MKNPFKLNNILTSAVSVAVGGGANVLADYAVKNIEALASLDQKTVNAVKIAAGAIGGSMISGKKYGWLKSACDGIAIVGVSNLVSSLMEDESSAESAAGLPADTIGRLRLGQKRFRTRKVSGVEGADFMGC